MSDTTHASIKHNKQDKPGTGPQAPVHGMHEACSWHACGMYKHAKGMYRHVQARPWVISLGGNTAQTQGHPGDRTKQGPTKAPATHTRSMCHDYVIMSQQTLPTHNTAPVLAQVLSTFEPETCNAAHKPRATNLQNICDGAIRCMTPTWFIPCLLQLPRQCSISRQESWFPHHHVRTVPYTQ